MISKSFLFSLSVKFACLILLVMHEIEQIIENIICTFQEISKTCWNSRYNVNKTYKYNVFILCISVIFHHHICSLLSSRFLVVYVSCARDNKGRAHILEITLDKTYPKCPPSVAGVGLLHQHVFHILSSLEKCEKPEIYIMPPGCAL